MQLVGVLPADYRERLESAESLVTRWCSTLTQDEAVLYDHVGSVAHSLLAECYSRKTIVPGVTTTKDLEGHYWQRCADLGLEVSFKPYFHLIRSDAAWDKFGRQDQVIHPGDYVRSDVEIRYLRLNTDHQQWAYIPRSSEDGPAESMKRLMADANHLQNIFMDEFKQGLNGNELLNTSWLVQKMKESPIPESTPTHWVYSCMSQDH